VTPIQLRLAAVLLLSLSLASLSQTAPSPRTPVLVELFTSEGCSSCPPADRLLATLQRRQPLANTRIVALEEHVDYWDRLGWKDRFSSAQLTERQNLYAPRLRFDDPYTPQMVVDGQTQFIGSDSAKAVAAIAKASQAPKVRLELARPVIDGRRITSSISVTTRNADLSHGDLYAILVTPSASTEVKSGENGGSHLDHVNVVRSFQRIGRLQDLSRGPLSFSATAPTGEDPGRMRLIVFAQLPDQGAVQGVAEAETSQTP